MVFGAASRQTATDAESWGRGATSGRVWILCSRHGMVQVVSSSRSGQKLSCGCVRSEVEHKYRQRFSWEKSRPENRIPPTTEKE
jgi:hypothetical protein